MKKIAVHQDLIYRYFFCSSRFIQKNRMLELLENCLIRSLTIQTNQTYKRNKP
jgi:hypothetical protein